MKDDQTPLLPVALPTATARKGHSKSKRIRVLVLAVVASIFTLRLLGHNCSRGKDKYTAYGENASWAEIAFEIESLKRDWGVPGLAVGVVHKGELVFAQGFGIKNDQLEPVTTDTLFQIGSTTKAFTSFVVGTLVDEKKLDWETPVTRTFPVEFYDKTTNQQANLIDIMSHRTGLPRHDLLMFLWETSDEILARLQYLQPSEPFREKWQYNNHMFNLAGEIAGNVSGLGWELLVKERVLKPLGMESTLTDPYDLPKSKDHARGYNTQLGFGGLPTIVPYDHTFWTTASKPAGSIMSSINDLVLWVSLINNQGVLSNGTRLISQEQFGILTSPHMLVEEDKPEYPIQSEFYGLGWFIETYRDIPRIQHGGNTIGYSTQIDTYPTQDLAIVVLSNAGGNPAPTLISNTIADRLLFPDAESVWSSVYRTKIYQIMWKSIVDKIQKISKRHWFTKPSLPLPEYQGIFTHPAYGTVNLTLKENGKDFNLTISGSQKTALYGVVGHWENNVFGVYELEALQYKDYWAPLYEFEFSEDASRVSVNVEEDVDPVVFERV
ncbi:UNVERIFIED_CONTAM: hypothetical protein HDU68_012857 [Siphonaria sp. JEL0065]|nr:hypothetical protein HDU68_012857 [Siphonaria sp. JEL0065]